jgi:hypothetical protein
MPRVDFVNGDCGVSIGDILAALSERGLEYTLRFVVPYFGIFGDFLCWRGA